MMDHERFKVHFFLVHIEIEKDYCARGNKMHVHLTLNLPRYSLSLHCLRTFGTVLLLRFIEGLLYVLRTLWVTTKCLVELIMYGFELRSVIKAQVGRSPIRRRDVDMEIR